MFGTEEQKQRLLPDIIKGKVKGCFAVTEPDAGLNTTALETRAERSGNGSGRIYTLTTECRDATGNTSQGTTTVTVPH